MKGCMGLRFRVRLLGLGLGHGLRLWRFTAQQLHPPQNCYLLFYSRYSRGCVVESPTYVSLSFFICSSGNLDIHLSLTSTKTSAASLLVLLND